MEVGVDFLQHLREEVGIEVVGGTSTLYAASTDLVVGSMTLVVERAVATGAIRLDMDPLDLLRAAGRGDDRGLRTGRESEWPPLVDVLIAGIRTRREEPSRSRPRKTQSPIKTKARTRSK